MPQAFCRLAAVNGGIYLLRKTPVEMHVAVTAPDPVRQQVADEGKQSSGSSFHSLVLEDGSRIKGEHLIMGEDYIPQEFLKNKTDPKDRSVARCIIVT